MVQCPLPDGIADARAVWRHLSTCVPSSKFNSIASANTKLRQFDRIQHLGYPNSIGRAMNIDFLYLLLVMVERVLQCLPKKCLLRGYMRSCAAQLDGGAAAPCMLPESASRRNPPRQPTACCTGALASGVAPR